jgi:hypothetical protein
MAAQRSHRPPQKTQIPFGNDKQGAEYILSQEEDGAI